MKKSILMAAAAVMALPANAATVTVAGNSSIYQIFGHSGSANGGATDAVLANGSVNAGDSFSFSATGLIGCCSYIGSGNTPDGATGSMNIAAYNGLSGISGNSLLPLVGVFTSETDPFGTASPAGTTYDASNPSSLSPLLNQVFYIGDGLGGLNAGSGAALSFVAPTGATRLYLGILDSHGFSGNPSDYRDNPGSFTVNFSAIPATQQSPSAVPELATWLMMIFGFGAVGSVIRSRRKAPNLLFASPT